MKFWKTKKFSNPSKMCEAWVPLGNEEGLVGHGLNILKTKMNYFDFMEMLKLIGVSDETLFEFSQQFNRMTSDLADT